jgi:hypothetical protein
VGDITSAGYTIGGPLIGKTGSAELGRLTVLNPATIGRPA